MIVGTKVAIVVGLALTFQGQVSAAPSKQFKTGWTRCRIDGDCTVIHVPCQFVCVNRKFTTHIQGFYSPLVGTFPCKEPDSWMRPESVCEDKKCQCVTVKP